MKAETERVRRIQDKAAPHYDRQIAVFERLLFGGGREWVCSRARGEVLELAVGSGRNLPFYQRGVRLTGIELSPKMLDLARSRAEALDRPADLRQGDAETLDCPDERFDTVTCTLGLCTIPDPKQAAAEAFRVLKAGGELLLLEHVRSRSRLVRAFQRLIEPLTLRFEADHLMREPLDYLSDVGFVVDEVQRSKLGIVERLRAHKPSLDQSE